MKSQGLKKSITGEEVGIGEGGEDEDSVLRLGAGGAGGDELDGGEVGVENGRWQGVGEEASVQLEELGHGEVGGAC